MMHLVCIVYGPSPGSDLKKRLASFDENALCGGGIEGQNRCIVRDPLVIFLGDHCCISKILQFLEGTLTGV